MALLVATFTFLLGTSGPIRAHTNNAVTIDCHVLFGFKDSLVTVIGETWSFDTASSEGFLTDFDLDHNGSFSDAESAAIDKEIFSPLSDVQYYTQVWVGEKELKGLSPFGFRATVSNGIVTFTFGLRLPAPVDPRASTLRLQIKDPDYTVSVTLAGNQPVLLRGAPTDRCNWQAKADATGSPTDAILNPPVISVTCKP